MNCYEAPLYIHSELNFTFTYYNCNCIQSVYRNSTIYMISHRTFIKIPLEKVLLMILSGAVSLPQLEDHKQRN